MKKIFTTLILAVMAINLFAQAPEKMSYQAIVRDNSNSLIIDKDVGMQISILQGSTDGSAVYVETQTPATNANGLISIEIGNGTVISGDFSSIDWSNGPYFIKTETDPGGGNNYSITGTSQLLSVPYALHASSVENDQVDDADADPANEIQNLELDANTLSISDGNSIDLSKVWSNLWSIDEKNNIYYNGGNVGIGISDPVYNLDIIIPAGEAYARLRSNNASSSFIIDKYSVSHLGQIIYQQNHVNKFYTGLLGNNNYRISTDKSSLNGIEVKESGDVEFSDGIKIGTGAGEGKVLTSDGSGNATWQTAPGAPKTKYMTIPGIAFQNWRPNDRPIDRDLGGYVTAGNTSVTQYIYLSYPIVLSEGAQITGLNATVFDNTSNNFVIRLYSNQFFASGLPPGGDEIVTIYTSGAAAEDRKFHADLSGVDPFDLTIDKDRVYYIVVYWRHTGPDLLYMAFEQVQLSYIE